MSSEDCKQKSRVILPMQTLRHQHTCQILILHSKVAESLSKNCRHFFYEHSYFALKKAQAEIIQIKL